MSDALTATAVEVTTPSGRRVKYLLDQVPAGDGEWRVWVLTSPRRDKYRVTEFPNGYWRCTCPAFALNGNGAGRWCSADGQDVCKHVSALFAVFGFGQADDKEEEQQ